MARSRYSNPDMWRNAADDAVAVAAGAFVACSGTTIVGITQLDWLQALNVSALAALLSLLTSIAKAR